MPYVEDYLGLLATARTEDHVLNALPDWQYAHFGEQVPLITGLNADLGFQPDDPRYLQANHLPTTAVGRLNGLVVVSANPGYDPERNACESDYRGQSAERNRSFCADFFHSYPEGVGSTSRYWTWVLGLWKAAFLGENDVGYNARGRDLWKVAHAARWPVGGIDLIPFHSSRDGITSQLHKLEDSRWLEVARSTLRMVCALEGAVERRSGPKHRLVLVTSARGHELTEELAQIQKWTEIGHRFFERELRALAWEPAPTTRVLSLPYQRPSTHVQ